MIHLSVHSDPETYLAKLREYGIYGADQGWRHYGKRFDRWAPKETSRVVWLGRVAGFRTPCWLAQG